MKGFLQRILQEIMKKDNTWNIRHLVDEVIVPSTHIEDCQIFGLSHPCHWQHIHGMNIEIYISVILGSVWLKGSLVLFILAFKNPFFRVTDFVDNFNKICNPVTMWTAQRRTGINHDVWCLEKTFHPLFFFSCVQQTSLVL